MEGGVDSFLYIFHPYGVRNFPDISEFKPKFRKGTLIVFDIIKVIHLTKKWPSKSDPLKSFLLSLSQEVHQNFQ